MENKYYTPTIEEFHVGFEFELKDYLEYQVDKDVHVLNRGWDKQVVTFDFFTKNKLMPYFIQSTRVKYLDQSDIESLGFKYQKHNTYYFYKDKWFIRLETTHKPDLIELEIRYEKIILLHKVFKIKNKSELIKLLKQLGINE
jgi:hypothetical protein